MIQQIGKHRVSHGCVMEGIADLMGNEKADIIWSDPPWGNLKYWQTMNVKMNPVVEHKKIIKHLEFLHQLFRIYSAYSKNLVILSYSTHQRNDLVDLVTSYGFQVADIILQKNKGGSKMYPCDLWVLSKKGVEVPPDYKKANEGIHGYKAVVESVRPFARPGATLLDPCCGLGLAARAACETGMTFRGNELNLARLKKTMEILQKDES